MSGLVGPDDEHGRRFGVAEDVLSRARVGGLRDSQEKARCNQRSDTWYGKSLAEPGGSSTITPNTLERSFYWCDKRPRRVVWFREQSAWPRGMGCEMKSR